MDLINRQDAISAIQNQAIHTPEALNDIGIAYYEGLHYALQVISMLPSAEPERKTGKWINDHCTNCGYGVFPWNNTPYCPRCGAKMEVEE